MQVDPSGPIATLRKLLLSEENIASFKRWAYEHWYYCGVIFFTFLLFMVRTCVVDCTRVISVYEWLDEFFALVRR